MNIGAMDGDKDGRSMLNEMEPRAGASPVPGGGGIGGGGTRKNPEVRGVRAKHPQGRGCFAPTGRARDWTRRYAENSGGRQGARGWGSFRFKNIEEERSLGWLLGVGIWRFGNRPQGLEGNPGGLARLPTRMRRAGRAGLRWEGDWLKDG